MRLVAITLYMIAHAHQVHIAHGIYGAQTWIDAYRHWSVGIGYIARHHLYWFLEHRG